MKTGGCILAVFKEFLGGLFLNFFFFFKCGKNNFFVRLRGSNPALLQFAVPHILCEL